MKIGLQLYSVREFCKTEEDLATTLLRVAKIGYRYVQVSGILPLSAEVLRKLLDDAGLTACSTHEPYEKIIHETSLVAEYYHTLGADVVACPGLPQNLHCAEGYETAGEQLDIAGKKLSEAGLSLVYHNHAIEFTRYEKRTGYEILLDPNKRSYLGTELDTYWVQFGGADPAQWIEWAAGRAPLCHFKDMTFKDTQVMVAVGEGNLNWPRILDACHKAGTKYALVELDSSPLLPLWESLEISFTTMKSWGLEVE